MNSNLQELFDSILAGQRRVRLAADSVRDFHAVLKRHDLLSPADPWDACIKEASGRLAYVADDLCLDKAIGDLSPGSIMDFDCVVTTTRQDRDGDVLETAGADLDPMAPLLWQHVPLMPCGKVVKQLSKTASRLMARCAVADTELGRDVAVLVEFGGLRISHGFKPAEWEPLQDDKGQAVGMRFLKFKVLEVSVVSVPSNEDAIILAHSRAKLHNPALKAWAGELRARLPKQVVGGFSTDQTPLGKLILPASGGSQRPQDATKHPTPTPHPIRWNRALSKVFDVAGQQLEPASMEIDWVSQWLEVPVKRICQSSDFAPGARMGSFLTGLRHALREYKCEDVRNLCHKSELPPQYETIQLNSKQRDTFLVRGTAFYRGPEPLVIDYCPHWGGISLTMYVAQDRREVVETILDNAWKWARDNNFLKGEAFALSGEFLQKTDEEFGDLFLEPENEAAVKRVLGRINSKGKAFRNHGQIYAGPPGTGKTLSGRILMNKADASFIWVSARDFYMAGAFGGLSMAFELAKELSPSVIFLEDVDNWLSRTSIDYLKTEMDGIGRSSGILTILTTNFPETLPEALIDRPGRFHDVCQFSLPAEPIRRAMLRRWLPELPDAKIADAAVKTDGYSGAHLYHLATFAKDIREADEVDMEKAVDLAIDKVLQQRDLINGIQLEGSRYRPTKELTKELSMLSEQFKAVLAKRKADDDKPEDEDKPKRPKGDPDKPEEDADKPKRRGEGDKPDEDDENKPKRRTIKLGKRRYSMLIESQTLIGAAHDHAEMKDRPIPRAMLRTAKDLIGTAIKEPENEDEEEKDDDPEKPEDQKGACPKCGAEMNGTVCPACGYEEGKDDDPAKPNPEVDDKPNPGMSAGRSASTDRLAVLLLAKFYGGERPSWDALHSLKDEIDKAIKAEEEKAVALLSA